ncbi:MAG: N-acetyltransferase [Bacteroidales bacterium]|nr:N-acetyltransferase [Bacteroidales bacterium]
MEYKLIENTDGNRFEMHIDGFVPYIEYTLKADKIYLNHTIVPKELGGRGIGSALVKQTLEILQNRKMKVVPVCSFVEAYINKHPEWKVVL